MRLALAVFVAGCVDRPALGVETAEIVGGSTSPQDRAAVALVSGGAEFCSGVLVEPTIVLTAAHCLPPNSGHAIEDTEVFFGADVSQGGTTIAIAHALANPTWAPDAFAGDIGIIALAEPAPVEPLAIEMDASMVSAGDVLRAVGYGISQPQATDPGVKRAGLVVVESVDAETFHLSADGTVTCSGDSGGPLFAGDLVVGLHSRSNCQTEALAERIDVHADFIADFIAGRMPVDAGEVAGGCRSTRGVGPGLVVIVAILLRRRRR
jgi:secreted trypsin-like serine protease